MSSHKLTSAVFKEDLSNLPYHHDHLISKVKKKSSKTVIKYERDKRDKVENFKAKIIEYLEDNEGKIDEPFIGEDMYTPMQFAAKYGVVGLADFLLKKNADPNFAPPGSLCATCDAQDNEQKEPKYRISVKRKSYQKSKPQHDGHCMSPLLLAAKYGQHEIIKLFKYYPEESFGEPDFVHCTDENNKLLDNLVNFKQTSFCRKETVLQIVLRQPMLLSEKKTDSKTADIKRMHQCFT